MKTSKAPFAVNQQKQISQDKRKYITKHKIRKRKWQNINVPLRKTSIVL